MKCINSALRYALPFALLLGMTTLSTTLVPTSAMAWELAGSKDGWSLYYMVGSDGQTHFAAVIEQNGHVLVSFNENVIDIAFSVTQGKSDPGPDQDTDKGIDKPDINALLKKVKGVTLQINQMPEKTPLGKWLDSEGGGFVPHWNPGDDDSGKGPGNPPQKNTGGLTAQQLKAYAKLMNLAARELNDIGGSMGGYGDVGDSTPGLPTNKNNNGNNGRGKGGGNGSDNNNGKRKYLGSDLSLGPRPDLVNPPHSKALNVMSPGLLDGGSSFSTNGPSGAGTAIDKGGGTTSHGAGAAGIR